MPLTGGGCAEQQWRKVDHHTPSPPQLSSPLPLYSPQPLSQSPLPQQAHTPPLPLQIISSLQSSPKTPLTSTVLAASPQTPLSNHLSTSLPSSPSLSSSPQAGSPSLPPQEHHSMKHHASTPNPITTKPDCASIPDLSSAQSALNTLVLSTAITTSSSKMQSIPGKSVLDCDGMITNCTNNTITTEDSNCNNDNLNLEESMVTENNTKYSPLSTIDRNGIISDTACNTDSMLQSQNLNTNDADDNNISHSVAPIVLFDEMKTVTNVSSTDLLFSTSNEARILTEINDSKPPKSNIINEENTANPNATYATTIIPKIKKKNVSDSNSKNVKDCALKTKTSDKANFSDSDYLDSDNNVNSKIPSEPKRISHDAEKINSTLSPVSNMKKCQQSELAAKSGNAASSSKQSTSNVINIMHRNSRQKTSSLIAETLKKLRNSNSSLTIVNISTSHPLHSSKRKGGSNSSSNQITPVSKSRVPTSFSNNSPSYLNGSESNPTTIEGPFCKTEIIDDDNESNVSSDQINDCKEFSFDACGNNVESFNTHNKNNLPSIDSKDFIANLINNCSGINGGNNGANGNGLYGVNNVSDAMDQQPTSSNAASFDLGQTAAMMMMLNNNNTSVTPAPSTGSGFSHHHFPTHHHTTLPSRRHCGSPSHYLAGSGSGSNNHNHFGSHYHQFGASVANTNAVGNQNTLQQLPQNSPVFNVSQTNSSNQNCNNSNATNTGNSNSNNPSNNGGLNNISLPSLLAPLGPHAPSFFLAPHSWHQQFRCMSPNMLMAIEAVRAGKMGFTQAGRTFGVNGRTLWVYYRRLGYKVHNTFRGRRTKDVNVHAGAASGGSAAQAAGVNSNTPMMPPIGALSQSIGNAHLGNNIGNIHHNRMAQNFANTNSSIFFANSNNANNNFSNVSGLGNSGSNLFSRNMPGANFKFPVETQPGGFQNFQSKFFENNAQNEVTAGLRSECANNSNANSDITSNRCDDASADLNPQPNLSSCLVSDGNTEQSANNPYASNANNSSNNSAASTLSTNHAATPGSRGRGSISTVEASADSVPVPSPSSLIGPMFSSGSSSFNTGNTNSGAHEEHAAFGHATPNNVSNSNSVNVTASVANGTPDTHNNLNDNNDETGPGNHNTSNSSLAISCVGQQQANFNQTGFAPMFFGHNINHTLNHHNFIGFHGSGDQLHHHSSHQPHLPHHPHSSHHHQILPSVGSTPNTNSVLTATSSASINNVSPTSALVKQEMAAAVIGGHSSHHSLASERRILAESTREVEETNSTLEALLEACTNRNVWQHNVM